MKSQHRDELRARFGELVTLDAPLAQLTTYRVGGPAAVRLEPRTTGDVSAAIEAVAELDLPWMVLGLGSNILVPDEGFDGVVMRFGKGMAAVERSGPDGEVWTVGAGLPTPLLAKRSAAAGLAGVHKLIGVPGTVGGGVFMNAGAHGQEFRDVVTWVDVVGSDGRAARIAGRDVPWRYRSSGLDGVVVATQLSLAPADPAILKRDIKRYMRWRRAGTPFDRPCCGSVFRNPSAEEITNEAERVAEPRTAGRFIEAAGLKGLRVGGAEVSTMHANYIVNTGRATAADVRGVIDAVQNEVFERYGVSLHLEVKIIQAAPSEKA